MCLLTLVPLGPVAVFLGFYCHSRFYTCWNYTTDNSPFIVSIHVNMIGVVSFDLALSSFPQCGSPLSLSILCNVFLQRNLCPYFYVKCRSWGNREMGQCAGMQQFIKGWQRNGARRRAECHVLVQTAPCSHLKLVCMLYCACLYVLKLFAPKIMTPVTITN